MAGFMEEPFEPFQEYEERYLLTEILKRSSVPPASLQSFILGSGIVPRWYEIALPHGRSVSACQKAYEDLLARQRTRPQASYPEISTSGQIPPKLRKRPFSGVESQTTGYGEIQPRPVEFAAVNDPQTPQNDPTRMRAASGSDSSRKKRGRPNKAEAELRAAEAKARGEIYPPPKKTKTPRAAAGELAPRPAEGIRMSTEGVPQSSQGVFSAFTDGHIPTAVMSIPPVSRTPMPAKDPFTEQKPIRSPKATSTDESRILPIDVTARAKDPLRTENANAGQSDSPMSFPPSSTSPKVLFADVRDHTTRAQPTPTQGTPSFPQSHTQPQPPQHPTTEPPIYGTHPSISQPTSSPQTTSYQPNPYQTSPYTHTPYPPSPHQGTPTTDHA